MKEIIDLKNLTDKYSDMIYRIALRYLGTKDDAEDIVQDVFTSYIAEVKAGKRFETEEYEKCWLIRVTRNYCCNEIGNARRRKSLPLNDVLYCELDISSENLLYNAMNKLPNKYKEIVMLFYIEDLKVNEISKILRISEANVKTRLKRARNYIKDYIKRGEKSFERI